jgi:cell division protein FtsZ
MGTAVGSGKDRARDAAMAAMASPLLESGAIDGARGILINITGSSKLKLSEVNEASSLIQSAAHEDANIIFGAVLDETMGEDVKITVIATGFRAEMPARRERMLSAAALPTQQSAPSVPKIVTPPQFASESQSPAATAPLFASEVKPAEVVSAMLPHPADEVDPTEAVASEPVSSYYEAARQQARSEAYSETRGRVLFDEAEPASAAVQFEAPAAYAPVAPEPPAELVPVKASVFDDDFFRQPSAIDGRSVQENGGHAAWPEARVPSFAGYAGEAEATDELEIPAFLRHRR